MKKSKLLWMMLGLSLLWAHAQTSKKEILKVTYVATPLSNFIVELLKKQIPDPKKRSEELDKIGQYKIYSNFYADPDAKESLFVFDHAYKEAGISITGYPAFVYKDADKNFIGKESFMGKDIYFKGKTQDLKWVITDKQKKIKDYLCRKAYLKNNSSTYAWFTTDVPIQGGPYIFLGLPGLVLEANTSFQNVHAETISYESGQEMKAKLKDVNSEENRKKSRISINEVFAKKNNFKRMAENGK